AVRVFLARHLLLGRQDRLDRAEVDVDHARVGALLHDAGDDVALLAAELAEHGVVGDVAQALADDLLRSVGGDAPEVLGVLLLLAHDGALVVGDRREHGDVAGLAVELGAGAVGHLAGLRDVLRVCGQHGLFDDRSQLIERNLLLAFDRTQQSQIDLHSSLPIQLSRRQTFAPTSPRRYPTGSWGGWVDAARARLPEGRRALARQATDLTCCRR